MLSQWTWVLPQLSYRETLVVTNNLIASMLWHRLTIIKPPETSIREVQRRIVIFWTGQHWTHASVLHLPLQDGGQGLTLGLWTAAPWRKAGMAWHGLCLIPVH